MENQKLPPIVSTVTVLPVELTSADGQKKIQGARLQLYSSPVPADLYRIGDFLLTAQHLVNMVEVVEQMKKDLPELFKNVEDITVKEIKSLKEMYDDQK